jgi:methyl-accepting chemotaxis protein
MQLEGPTRAFAAISGDVEQLLMEAVAGHLLRFEELRAQVEPFTRVPALEPLMELFPLCRAGLENLDFEDARAPSWLERASGARKGSASRFGAACETADGAARELLQALTPPAAAEDGDAARQKLLVELGMESRKLHVLHQRLHAGMQELGACLALRRSQLRHAQARAHLSELFAQASALGARVHRLEELAKASHDLHERLRELAEEHTRLAARLRTLVAALKQWRTAMGEFAEALPAAPASAEAVAQAIERHDKTLALLDEAAATADGMDLQQRRLAQACARAQQLVQVVF